MEKMSPNKDVTESRVAASGKKTVRRMRRQPTPEQIRLYTLQRQLAYFIIERIYYG